MSVAVAVLVWFAAGYRLMILLRHRTLLNCMYWLSLTTAAAAFTAKVCEPTIDSVLGPYGGDLVKHLLVVAMGAFIQLFILVVEVGRPSRRSVLVRIGIAVLVAAGMAVAFAAAPIHSLEGADDLDESLLGLREIQAYRLIFNAYLTYVLIDNVRLARRFAAAPGDAGRSTNLQLFGWGSAVALVYSGSRLLSVLSVMITGRPLPVVETIGSAAALIGGVFVALSAFSPRAVTWLRDWQAARSGLRRLHPLWRDLTTCYPDVVLPTRKRPLSARRTEFLFDRRVVESSECLRLARLPESATTHITRSPHPLRALADELHEQRDGWASATGPTPADLLAPAVTHIDEQETLLDLADLYAAASVRPVRESAQL
jgi:hypothetical protein